MEPFKIITDHRNLVYCWEPQKLIGQQVNWTIKLQNYNFIIKHVLGTLNAHVDTFSRPDGVEKTPPKVGVILLEQVFIQAMMGREEPETELMEEEKGKWILQYHGALVAGHPGIKRMVELIKRHEDGWKGMKGDGQRYIAGCVVCQKAKPNYSKQPNLLHPLPVPDEPWDIISWDLIGLLLESRGYNTIVTVTDHPAFVSKWHSQVFKVLLREQVVDEGLNNRSFITEVLMTL
jgi:hypothetical protein